MIDWLILIAALKSCGINQSYYLDLHLEEWKILGTYRHSVAVTGTMQYLLELAECIFNVRITFITLLFVYCFIRDIFNQYSYFISFLLGLNQDLVPVRIQAQGRDLGPDPGLNLDPDRGLDLNLDQGLYLQIVVTALRLLKGTIQI